jgi:hypothetical protein
MSKTKNIITTILSTFLVVAVVYAANNYAITSGQPLDVTTWDNL